jgi:glycosyltransferase involved in cell wall biosynthesis
MLQKRIAIVNPGSEGVYYHRFLAPFSLIKEDYAITVCDGFNKNNPVENYDIIILNRTFRQPFEILNNAKIQGIKIILDLDDKIDLPRWHHNWHPYNNEIYREQTLKVIRIADAVWCATEPIFNSIKHKNKLLVQNALNYEHQQWKQPISPIYDIGWTGGNTHLNDLAEFSKLMNWKNYKICFGGYVKDNISWLAIQKIYGEVLDVYPAVDAQEYGAAYSKMKTVIIPLKVDDFNNSKSNIKVLEAGAYNLPVIAQKCTPYINLPRSCGYLCNSKMEWQSAIKRLKKDHILRSEMGFANGEWTRKNYDINKINQLRIQTL